MGGTGGSWTLGKVVGLIIHGTALALDQNGSQIQMDPDGSQISAPPSLRSCCWRDGNTVPCDRHSAPSHRRLLQSALRLNAITACSRALVDNPSCDPCNGASPGPPPAGSRDLVGLALAPRLAQGPVKVYMLAGLWAARLLHQEASGGREAAPAQLQACRQGESSVGDGLAESEGKVNSINHDHGSSCVEEQRSSQVGGIVPPQDLPSENPLPPPPVNPISERPRPLPTPQPPEIELMIHQNACVHPAAYVRDQGLLGVSVLLFKHRDLAKSPWLRMLLEDNLRRLSMARNQGAIECASGGRGFSLSGWTPDGGHHQGCCGQLICGLRKAGGSPAFMTELVPDLLFLLALLHVSTEAPAIEGTVQGQPAAPLPASRCQQSTAAATSTAPSLTLPWLQVDLCKALEHDTLLVVLLNAVSPSCPTSAQQAGGDDACRWGDCASCTAARGLARGICLRLLRGGLLDARLSRVEAALTEGQIAPAAASQRRRGGNGNGNGTPLPGAAPSPRPQSIPLEDAPSLAGDLLCRLFRYLCPSDAEEGRLHEDDPDDPWGSNSSPRSNWGRGVTRGSSRKSLRGDGVVLREMRMAAGCTLKGLRDAIDERIDIIQQVEP